MAGQFELLAPAGSFQTLKAVIYAGADAVYAGGSRFGARAYAENFDRDELLSAIDFAHLHDKKLYLTVNTLLKQKEIEEQFYEYLLPFYERGIDAVIVQDFGVMQFVRRNFKNLPIHASTQMTILGTQGAKLLEGAGVVRIVTARELSLYEIAKIHEAAPSLELETFVHGALCYCYSGQCLFSSMLGGRSGNRGRCAQPCRLPYTADLKGGRLSGQIYPLSPKDLCALKLLPRLAESGVCSFKIEGRMKQAEYAAGVVSVYRKYLDHYIKYGEEGYAVQKEDEEKLFALGNRSGFTEGYFRKQNGPDMITLKSPAHEKKDGFFTDSFPELKLKIQGSMQVRKNIPVRMTVSYQGCQASVTADAAGAARSKPLTEGELRTRLQKTGNTPFVFEKLHIEVEEGLFLPVSSVNELRRRALEQLTEQYLSSYRRQAMPKSDCQIRLPQAKQTVITALAETKEQLATLFESPLVSCIYVDSNLFAAKDLVFGLQEACRRAGAQDKQLYYRLPAVFRENTREFYASVLSEIHPDGFLAGSYDALGFLLEQGIFPDRIRLDYSLYTWSNESRAAFAHLGIAKDTVSPELNRRELMGRDNAGSEIIFYGRIPLMTSAQCIRRNLDECSHMQKVHMIKDRYGVCFPVKNCCNECYNVIYNSRPLCLFPMADELKSYGFTSFRLWFTIESKEQVRQALLGCTQALSGSGPVCLPKEYTYGHYKRGVE